MIQNRKYAAPLPLALLRSTARRLGEGGGFVLLSLTMTGAFVLMGSQSGMVAKLMGILLVAGSILSVFARSLDTRGQRAMRRMAAPAAQTEEELRLRRRFGLRDDSDAETVRKDFAVRMKAWHSDCGTGGVDMDEVKKARNRLFHLVSGRGDAATGTELIAEWGREAGPLGRAWGTLLPSDRLLSAFEQSGVEPGTTTASQDLRVQA